MSHPFSPGIAERYGPDWGWHFDALVGDHLRPGERRCYLELAGPPPGPVLEPACGAGRVLTALRAAGYEVWGTDRSPAMLALAERRLAAVMATTKGASGLPADAAPSPAGGGRGERASGGFEGHPRSQGATPRQATGDPHPNPLPAGEGAATLPPYQLVHQPLEALDLPQQFSLILLPLEAFALLPDAAAAEAFLRAARRHAQPDGRLTMEINVAVDRSLQPTVLPPVRSPDGRLVWGEVRWRREPGCWIEQTTYRTADRPPVISEDRYRALTADGVVAALETTGWPIERRQADWLGTPYRAGDPVLIVTARAAGRDGPPAAE